MAGGRGRADRETEHRAKTWAIRPPDRCCTGIYATLCARQSRFPSLGVPVPCTRGPLVFRDADIPVPVIDLVVVQWSLIADVLAFSRVHVTASPVYAVSPYVCDHPPATQPVHSLTRARACIAGTPAEFVVPQKYSHQMLVPTPTPSSLFRLRVRPLACLCHIVGSPEKGTGQYSHEDP